MTGKNLGISDIHLAESVHVLNAMLANEVILSMKTTKAHWCIRASQVHALHALWTAQIDGMRMLTNEAAERVRALGAYPLGTVAESLRNSSLTEDQTPFLYASVAVDALRSDHEHACRMLRAATREFPSEGAEDVGTLDLLTRAVQFHEQCASMLGAFVEGVATVEPGAH